MEPPMPALDRSLQLLALLPFAALAGFFYAYWCSVMPGLAHAEPAVGAAAMQAINLVVRNPAFAPSFFGPLLVAPLAALACWRAARPRAAFWLLAALAAHVGAMAITAGFNVPLNLALAPLDPQAAQTQGVWRAYVQEWGAWNAARMAASFAATACAGASLAAR
jgi:uncharacterized membrane protein